jgi:hypothetical protein
LFCGGLVAVNLLCDEWSYIYFAIYLFFAELPLKRNPSCHNDNIPVFTTKILPLGQFAAENNPMKNSVYESHHKKLKN